jgi:hypothetical protein
MADPLPLKDFVEKYKLGQDNIFKNFPYGMQRMSLPEKFKS